MREKVIAVVRNEHGKKYELVKKGGYFYLFSWVDAWDPRAGEMNVSDPMTKAKAKKELVRLRDYDGFEQFTNI